MELAGYPAKGAVLEREFNQRDWGKPISLQAVCRWLRGEAIPSQDKLNVLAEWLQVEPQALRFGDESIQKVRAVKSSVDAAVSYAEREVFETFLKLPPDKRKVVREVILAFAKAQQADTPR
jgi:transcriptional regulator with XRE-family HTH domain